MFIHCVLVYKTYILLSKQQYLIVIPKVHWLVIKAPETCDVKGLTTFIYKESIW